jgi:hypothetical protein
MTAVAFIIPTIGRPELARALDSVREQFAPGWEAIVCGDGFLPGPFDDERISSLRGPDTASAGLTRAYAVASTVINSQAEWLAMLDDDDTISPHYTARLGQIDSRSVDIAVFRMFHRELGVLPDPVEPKLTWGQVGISFAVSKAFLLDTGVNFCEERNPYAKEPGMAVNEDIGFLRDASRANARILLHPSISYFVRDARP